MTLAHLLQPGDEYKDETVSPHTNFDMSLGELSLDDNQAISSVETSTETTEDTTVNESDDATKSATEIKNEEDTEREAEELAEKEKTDDGIFKEDSTVALADDDTLKTLTTESLIEKRRALLFLSNGQNATTRDSFSFFSEELDKLEEELASRGVKLT